MKLILQLIVCIICLIVGFVIAKIISVPILTIDKNVNGVEVISLLSTFLIALFFYLYLDKNKDDNIREKELIIEEIKQVIEFTENQSHSFKYQNADFISVTSGMKRLIRKIGVLKSLLKDSNISCDTKQVDEIKKLARTLKKLQTDSPRQNPSMPASSMPMVISNSLVTYADFRRAEIDSSYDNLRKEMVSFLLVVNKG